MQASELQVRFPFEGADGTAAVRVGADQAFVDSRDGIDCADALRVLVDRVEVRHHGDLVWNRDGQLADAERPRACDGVDYAQCATVEMVGECDCLDMHAAPYVLSYEPSVPPLLELLDTRYRAMLSMVDSYFSYVVPEPDFNHSVSLLEGRDGDHYEETVSASSKFATRLQEAQLRLDDRW